MSMQYDVKASYRTTDGALVATRARLKGVLVNIATAGAAALLYDNASAASGTTLLTLSTAIAGSYYIPIPGEGILAKNGVYLDINGAAAVTLFYG
jgi:hypothetical protein